MSVPFFGRIAVASLLVALTWLPARAQDSVLSAITLPPGFKIELYAEVPGARSLVYVPETRTLFAGSRQSAIHSVHDMDGDGTGEMVLRRASGLKVPNGIAWRDGKLYAALQDRVIYWDMPADPRPRAALPEPVEIRGGLPDKRHHGWRYASFGPDGKLYVSLGAACNICELTGLEGTLVRMNPDGSEFEEIATGIRNSVGFDWHPETGDMYFTDNGADNMGDDIPPDELNRWTEKGQHFGFPYLGGADARLTGFENAAPPEDAVAPVVNFQAHVAALGIHFYEGGMFPEEYRNDAFVAQHGSWNRSEPVGYRIMRIRFKNGEAVGKEVFAEGWLRDDGGVLGRPVDFATLPDGSLLVSDDGGGRIYRITYEK